METRSTNLERTVQFLFTVANEVHKVELGLDYNEEWNGPIPEVPKKRKKGYLVEHPHCSLVFNFHILFFNFKFWNDWQELVFKNLKLVYFFLSSSLWPKFVQFCDW
jgi:hypothetical protein